MAEAFLNAMCPHHFAAQSAGIEPGKLNTFVVQVMQEAGIDISRNKTKAVFDFIHERPPFDYVITVCDEIHGQRCPAFPPQTTRLQWGFPDPSAFTGTDEEKLVGTREVRDTIKARVDSWLDEMCARTAR